MSTSRWARRALFSTIGGAAALGLGVSAASAHHCYIPLYSLNAPASPNWLTFTAEDGAMIVAGYTADCDEAVEAGYAALRAINGPVAIKIFEHMTIGHPKGEDSGSQNPNGANGVGLEYFGAGSTLADEMVGVWIEGAESVDCG